MTGGAGCRGREERTGLGQQYCQMLAGRGEPVNPTTSAGSAQQLRVQRFTAAVLRGDMQPWGVPAIPVFAHERPPIVPRRS